MEVVTRRTCPTFQPTRTRQQFILSSEDLSRMGSGERFARRDNKKSIRQGKIQQVRELHLPKAKVQ